MGRMTERNNDTGLREADIFDDGDLDLCFYCHNLFPKSILARIIKDTANWEDGLALTCPFCSDEHTEEQQDLAWEVMKAFLADHSLIVLYDYADYSDDETTAKYDDCFVLDDGSSLHSWEITSVAAGIIGPITVGQRA